MVKCGVSILWNTMQSLRFSRPEYWSEQPFPSSRDLPNSGIKPRSPALQVDSLPTEPPRKPKNTGVGSLSLLQQIFLTQELNWGVLSYRQILYQMSFQGSPSRILLSNKKEKKKMGKGLECISLENLCSWPKGHLYLLIHAAIWMDESRGNCAAWKKPVSKGCILYAVFLI